MDQPLPPITPVINKSMAESLIPLCLKRTTITPLLKRSLLDKEDRKNYRHISSLLFISNFIEKVITRGMEEHLKHSTECALLKVHSDIAEVVDKGSMTGLIMLYLSAVFL